MERKLFFVLMFLVLSSAAAYVVEADADYTTRLKAALNVSIYSPQAVNGKIFLGMGEEFSVNVTAKCYNKSCETVDMKLLLCNGTYCENFFYLDSSRAEIFSEKDGSIKGQCKYVDRKVDRIKDATTGELLSDEMLELLGNKFVCRNYVRLKANRVGSYTLIYEVSSTTAPTVYSEPLIVVVAGCGDNICAVGEDVVSCPRDCCEMDCSAVYDNLCHKSCDGFNNCSMDSECVGKSSGYQSCVSDSSYISCCRIGKRFCEDEQYCLYGYCLNCSRKCDGVCDSRRCYKTDPDCDVNGNASNACCGNGLVEFGEECETSVAVSCLKGNCINCRCIVTASTTQQVETTTSTIELTTTSYTEISSTTSLPEENISPPSLPQKEGGVGFDLSLIDYIVFFLVGAAALFFSYKHLSKYMAKKEYASLRLKQELLKKDKESVMEKYAMGRINKEDASKQIYDLEEKISRLEERIQLTKKRL